MVVKGMMRCPFLVFSEKEVEEGLPGINWYVIVNVNNRRMYTPSTVSCALAVEDSLFSGAGGVYMYI